MATVTNFEDLTSSQGHSKVVSAAWGLSSNGIAVRLFLTCWLVYTLHFATNIVREVYPAVGLGDHFSFRLDEYAHMHPDLFEKEGYGWHIGNNPGASMVAAIPYAIARPLIDRIVERVQRKRSESGQTEPPEYKSPWPMAQEFYKEAWRRGLDIKLGLASFVMQSMCMAPCSALGVVVMFFVLRRLFGSDKKAFWLTVLYAFGTPVFFRSGYLNQNLMLGHIAFMGFVAMWNPATSLRWSTKTRFFLGGLAGGIALLFDYSGAVLLLALFCYGMASRLRATSLGDTARHAWSFTLGTLGPVGLLLFYQWQSFGHPLYPGQHWMPPVEWIELGYQGYGLPQFELLLALAFDYRFGLFVSCPLMLLAILAPLFNRGARRLMPGFEIAAMLAFSAALWIFFSGSNYTRLQFNTGIRYLSPVLPFLFIPAAVVLTRLPRFAVYFLAVLSVTESWCLAMHRDVERSLGVLDPILQVFLGGFKLPVLTTLSRMQGQFGDFMPDGVSSPIPIFLLAATILYGIWTPRFRGRTIGTDSGSGEPLFGAPTSSRAMEVAAAQRAYRSSPPNVDVVIPVLNEAHVLEKSLVIVRQFLHGQPNYAWRIVIIDNGSTDGTYELAERLSNELSDVEFLHLTQKGRGRALRYAWMQSKADIVCYMDVDLSTNLSHLPELIGAIANQGYDIAIGSRLSKDSKTRRSVKREIISRMYNIFVKAVLFTRFSDAQCGFKAVSREVVDNIVPLIEDQSWFFDTELLVLAEKGGYGIKDIPVVWIEDDDSRVRILRTAWDDIKGVLRMRRQLWSSKFVPAAVGRVKREKT